MESLDLEHESSSIKVKITDTCTEKNQTKALTSLPLSSKIIAQCNSETLKSNVNIGLFTVRIPIVLAEARIHINIENKLCFSKPASSIKNIRRKITLTECTLLPQISKLFLCGVVKKSIEYTEACFSNNKIPEGNIKNLTVSFPFDFVTEIQYMFKPEIFEAKNDILKSNEGGEIFTETIPEFTDIRCQLVHADFEEINIHDNNSNENIDSFKTAVQKCQWILQ